MQTADKFTLLYVHFKRILSLIFFLEKKSILRALCPPPHRKLNPLIPATEPESHKIADQVRDEVNGSAMRFAKRFSSEARFFFYVVQAVGLFLIRTTEKANLFGFAGERIENM